MFTDMAATISSATVTAFGAATTNDDVYIFTNEFGALHAHDTGRDIPLLDNDGGNDTLNLAAVTSGSVIDYQNGMFSVAGYTTYGSVGSSDPNFYAIETIIGGDGNDIFRANITNTTLRGMRGNDTLDGNIGNDALFGGTEGDVLRGGGGHDTLDGGEGVDVAVFSAARSQYQVFSFNGAIAVLTHGSDGRDLLRSIEHLDFQDAYVSTSSVAAFDAFQYLATHGDLTAVYGANAQAGFDHYFNYGFSEGRLVDGFDAFQYVAGYGDLTALYNTYGGTESYAAQHYLAYGRGEGRLLDAFDGIQYVAGYNDLIAAYGTNETASAEHYVKYGFGEGRARDSFDGIQYVAGYNDLIAAYGMNEAASALHFVQYGFGEGRLRDSFDGLQYIASHGDLIQAFGVNEGAGAASLRAIRLR